MASDTGPQAVLHVAANTITTITTTTIPITHTSIMTVHHSISTTALPTVSWPIQTTDQSECTSLIHYKFAVGILVTIIGVAMIILAITFCYVKPKRWQAKGAASRDSELQQLKKENEEIKNARLARAGGMPEPMFGMGMGPRGGWF